MYVIYILSFFFFFNDTATTEIYTLSLHDALPISVGTKEKETSPIKNDKDIGNDNSPTRESPMISLEIPIRTDRRDRKSTRLNSSHDQISYAVFCLKKKKINKRENHI